MLAAAISVPAVRDLWVQRAEVVQDYDGGSLGRFERQVDGFSSFRRSRWDYGPFEFGKLSAKTSTTCG